MANIEEFSQKIRKNLESVILGKRAEIRMLVVNLLADGHLLIEDVPGVGKTVLAHSLAKSLGGSFSRIQFTPDMLPSDITGVSIFNQDTREFEFRPGPLMAQFVLADEINRATPKTQAALLEAMQERQVTVEGTTRPLPKPFMVFATQNPIEYEGTFPLPEAQLDRFLMRIRLGYPEKDDEMEVLSSHQHTHPMDALEQVATGEELMDVQAAVRDIYVSEAIKSYIVDLTRGTREHAGAYLGASTRGSLALFRASQAKAAIDGREFVLPEDVKIMAEPVLSHRIILGPTARLGDTKAEEIIRDVIDTVQVPMEEYKPGEKTEKA